MSSDILRFGSAKLASVLGSPPEMAVAALSDLSVPDLLYRPLSSAELSKTLADIRDAIDHQKLRVAGNDDPTVWQKGWAELLERIGEQQITVDTLRPQYFHAGVPCRLQGRYIAPQSDDFEYWVGLGIRRVLFNEFLAGRQHVIEFGCGTGINLLLLADLLPQARLTGCDWAEPSQSLLARMARETGRKIDGHRFNMLRPSGDDSLIEPDTAVLTVHALEQLGTHWGPFLDYLQDHSPNLCVHIEPLFELYDPNDEIDELARQYHQKRNYLRGFLPAIQEMASQGRAEILALRRVKFGGLYHEAYSLLVWRPR